jgi:cell division protein FtsL
MKKIKIAVIISIVVVIGLIFLSRWYFSHRTESKVRELEKHVQEQTSDLPSMPTHTRVFDGNEK